MTFLFFPVYREMLHIDTVALVSLCAAGPLCFLSTGPNEKCADASPCMYRMALVAPWPFWFETLTDPFVTFP